MCFRMIIKIFIIFVYNKAYQTKSFSQKQYDINYTFKLYSVITNRVLTSKQIVMNFNKN